MQLLMKCQLLREWKAKEKTMESRTIENVTDATKNLAHLSHQVVKAKTLIDDVIDDGKHKLERSVKRGRIAVEDCIEDTTYFIKRHPWESVGVAVGAGTIDGLLVSWLTNAGKRESQAR